MSFAFSWPRAFPSAFYETARNNLEQAMNAGSKLPLAADRILVQELHLGTIPPELDLLEINQLSIDGSFSGSFFLSYNGNAYISLVTHLHVRVPFPCCSCCCRAAVAASCCLAPRTTR